MSLGDERAILEGRWAGLKMQKMELEARIHGNLRAAKALLAASSVKKIADIDIEGAADQLRYAAGWKSELNDVLVQIGEIVREIGD